MDNIAMYIGYATGALIALKVFLVALNRLIKMLPITANNIYQLFTKSGWKVKRKMSLPDIQ